MATFVTYSLLILDVLVIALLLQLIVWGPVWLLRRRRRAQAVPTRSRRTPAAPPPVVEPTPVGFGVGARKRRCDDCRSGWVGAPESDASVLVLRVRRAARRRAKRRGRPVPEWAERRGWDRCPSCFSTNVRDSRRQPQVSAR